MDIKHTKAFKEVVGWRVKNDFLKKQIGTLEKTKNFPIFCISCFLLKSQLIEFELKQLITSLDLHLSSFNTSPVLETVIKTPKHLDDRKMTLGKLKDEIDKYDGKILDELKKNLSGLVKLRNSFVHELFNPGNINELIVSSEKGLEVANNVIKSIETVDELLKENDHRSRIKAGAQI